MTSGRLGAGTYSASIHYRGGKRLLTHLPSTETGSWERRVDATSTASVMVRKKALGRAETKALSQVKPWAHELSIYRDGGLIWQGPLKTGLVESRETITLPAEDVTAWLDVRVNHHAYAFTGTSALDLTYIARWLINDGLGPDDPNIMAHAEYHESGIVGERAAEKETVIVLDELDELARNGLDYTTIGRRIIVAGELNPIVPKIGTLTDDDFLTELEVEQAGADAGTRQIVVGDGVVGEAGGTDSYLGLIERLVREDGVLDARSATASARARLAVSNPVPMILRVPDGAQLSPEAPITLDQLVAGVGVEVSVRRYVWPVVQRQRLIRVVGDWTSEGEKIGVTLAPYGSAA